MAIEAKSFLLRPDTPPGGRPRQPRPGESPNGALSDPLRSYAEEAGLVMRRPPLTSYTVPALEASEFAKDNGLFDAFHQQTYRAYWEFAKDVGSVPVLQEVARDVGLDPDALAQALGEGRYRARVQEDIEAAQKLGVSAIPSFLMGGFFFSGARRWEGRRSPLSR